jgi:hypothetical protein
MRLTRVFLIVLCIGAGSHVLAADPPAPSSAVPPGQSATAVPAAPAGITATPTVTAIPAAAPTAAPAKEVPATKSDVTPEQMKAFRAAGYKPEVHNGRTLFCRSEPQIGTRFESKTCGDADEIERSTRNSQELAERIQSKAYTKANGNP